MINFDKLERELPVLTQSFATAPPYPHVVIDGFCHAQRLMELCGQIPDPVREGLNRSRDYVFARNKFEKSGFAQVSSEFAELYNDLVSTRFQRVLQEVTGEPVFVDPDFHGGGLHQGGERSFLDMHVDFDAHPAHRDWFRNLNVLLYLNPGWRPEYRGELKLRHHARPDSQVLVEPVFNRCVIMFTRDYTLHGYDEIDFPAGMYRRSIAAYAYSIATVQTPRSTTWFPESGSGAKRLLGRNWPALVRVKNALFGSATAKNT